MLIKIPAPRHEIGAPVIQYFPKQNWSCLYGSITKILDGAIIVDFGDLITQIPLEDVFYSINTDTLEEHYTIISHEITDDMIIHDFRKS